MLGPHLKNLLNQSTLAGSQAHAYYAYLKCFKVILVCHVFLCTNKIIKEITSLGSRIVITWHDQVFFFSQILNSTGPWYFYRVTHHLPWAEKGRYFIGCINPGKHL